MDAIPEIDVAGARAALKAGEHVFVDIRDPASYAGEHISGALHLHDGNVADFVKNADKSRPVIVYCYHGNNSIGGAAYLLEQGFQTVHSLRGGFEEWRSTPDSI